MKGLKLLMPLTLIIAILFIAPVGLPTGNEGTATGRYVEGQWVSNDGKTLEYRLVPDLGIPFSFREPDCLYMPYDKYLKAISEGSLGKIKGVSVMIGEEEGLLLALIEPETIKVTIPISGTLAPGTYRRYGPYYSCVAISVSVTWIPSDQTLGIGIYDVQAGQGYGYWYTGGSASHTFSTDYTKGYYIDIFGYPSNTKSITYSGTITLYIW
ncbi:MAG: hypothetical protein ACUVRA_04070 [Candidatus Bathyarchaeaceae archaeon]